MPNISWNEIRQRSLSFSREWSGATREQADKQTFWNEFFNIFGITRRVVATFEEPVKRIKGTTGFIDLFWPGKLLVEHKTAGHSLDTAESQAFAYFTLKTLRKCLPIAMANFTGTALPICVYCGTSRSQIPSVGLPALLWPPVVLGPSN